MTQQSEKIEQGKSYSVQDKDTLKSIAERAYRNADKWKSIEDANIKKLESYHNRPLPAEVVLHIPDGGGDGISAHIERGKAYTVQVGDTRKSIAERAYHNADKWKSIEDANVRELESYHNRPLPAGIVLHIPAGGGDGISAHIERGKGYNVRSGDTLKSIAVRAYHNADKWKSIEDANIKKLESYHDAPLPAGVILHIPDGGGDGISAH